jgi:hypothetical protein
VGIPDAGSARPDTNPTVRADVSRLGPIFLEKTPPPNSLPGKAVAHLPNNLPGKSENSLDAPGRSLKMNYVMDAKTTSITTS